jgi:hypothetical protein
VAEPTSGISNFRILPGEASQTPVPAELLAIKLVPPAPRSSPVARPRLLRRLDEGSGHRAYLEQLLAAGRHPDASESTKAAIELAEMLTERELEVA